MAIPNRTQRKMQEEEKSLYHVAIEHFFGNNHWICIDNTLTFRGMWKVR
ncbi:MAG: hypothetical protein WBF90_34960 [Rivularia sp. (in: cyanobacteria)]